MLVIIGFIFGAVSGIAAYVFVNSHLKHSSMDLKIKTCHIGNKTYSVHTIKTANLPFWEVYQLNTQVDDLKYIVKEIVDKIILYRLEDFYDTDDIVQRNIDAFCNNIMELKIVCSECQNMSVDTKILNNAVNKVWTDNWKILHNLKDFSAMLDEYIEFHDDSLFNVHSNDAEIQFGQLEEIKQAKQERETAEDKKVKNYLKDYGVEDYLDEEELEETQC